MCADCVADADAYERPDGVCARYNVSFDAASMRGTKNINRMVHVSNKLGLCAIPFFLLRKDIYSV